MLYNNYGISYGYQLLLILIILSLLFILVIGFITAHCAIHVCCLVDSCPCFLVFALFICLSCLIVCVVVAHIMLCYTMLWFDMLLTT